MLSERSQTLKSIYFMIPFACITRTRLIYSDRNKSSVTSARAGGGWGLTCKEHKETFWGKSIILYFDRNVGNLGMSICQNSSDLTPYALCISITNSEKIKLEGKWPIRNTICEKMTKITLTYKDYLKINKNQHPQRKKVNMNNQLPP